MVQSPQQKKLLRCSTLTLLRPFAAHQFVKPRKAHHYGVLNPIAHHSPEISEPHHPPALSPHLFQELAESGGSFTTRVRKQHFPPKDEATKPYRHPVIYLLRMYFGYVFGLKRSAQKQVFECLGKECETLPPPWKLNKYPLKNCLLEDGKYLHEMGPFFRVGTSNVSTFRYTGTLKPRFPRHPMQTRESIWMFPRMGVPQNGWFIMENLIIMDDLEVPGTIGTTIFGNIHVKK